jgi:hypothetical protein
MVEWILDALFGCSHQRTTFPLTAGRQNAASRTYVVCLDCGREFAYNWADMRIGERVSGRVRAAEAQPSFR